MQYVSVDTICRRWLLEKNLPIHWYAEGLFHITSCVRELAIDTLKIVNTVQLPVDDLGNVELPGDFQDDVGVSINGLEGLNFPSQSYINPLRMNNATTGVYEEDTSLLSDVFTELNYGTTGGFFFGGSIYGGTGGNKLGYSIVPGQRRMQMSSGFAGGGIILVYVSDGQSIDNATQIDIKAQNCINSWIDWKSSPNAGINLSNEGRTFYSNKKNLKARLSNLTANVVKGIIRGAYKATIKN